MIERSSLASALGHRIKQLTGSIFHRQYPASAAASDQPVCIVIYGTHSPDWHTALGAQSPVWQRVPEVADVVAMPSEWELPPYRADMRTVVLPLMESHILSCPRDRHDGLLPSDEAIRILSDKANFADFVDRHRLNAHVPKRFKSLSRSEVPCVLKRCDLNGGQGVAVATSADELLSLRYSEPWRGHHVILQAFERSPHQYVTHAVCVRGRIVAEVSYRQTLMDDPTVRRWSSQLVCERFTLPDAARSVLEKFIRPLAYDGPCNFDYIFRENASICVFEINPRLGGSLMMTDNVDDLALILRATIAAARPLAAA